MKLKIGKLENNNIDKQRIANINGLLELDKFLVNSQKISDPSLYYHKSMHDTMLKERNNMTIELLNQCQYEEILQIQSLSKELGKGLLPQILKGQILTLEDYNKRLEECLVANTYEPKSNFIENNLGAFDNYNNIRIMKKDQNFIQNVTVRWSNIEADKFKNNEIISIGSYEFKSAVFSEDFKKSFIDCLENRDLYLNHPKVGLKKLTKVLEDLAKAEASHTFTKCFIECQQFAIEVDL